MLYRSTSIKCTEEYCIVHVICLSSCTKAYYFVNKAQREREKDTVTKTESGFLEFIVLRSQIKLDSILSQVYITFIKMSVKFQIQFESEISQNAMVKNS
jgi:hypothetical protein